VRIPVSLGVPQLIETLEKEAGMEQVHVKQRE
jgi:hypothetical protein